MTLVPAPDLGLAALAAASIVAQTTWSTPQVVAAPLLVALATAILTLLTRPSDTLQRAVSLLGGVGYLVAVAVLFREVVLPFGSRGETLVYQVSGWQPPFGIVLVADPLAAFMLGLGGIVSLGGIVFSTLYVTSYGQRLSFHPLYHFMMVGVTGSFLTGDIFNLFVWFEVMLMSSYILVLFYSGPEHTRAALNYVVVNLLGSAVMLVAIGGLYATTGTLNMADIARRLVSPEQFGVAVAPMLGLAAILLSVFALKAGLVPFQFWVPAAYRAAPAPVTAVLASVVKKVGVYAIVRLYFTVFAAGTLSGLNLPLFADGQVSFLAFFGPVLFLMAAASILFGGFGALGRDDLDGLLAFSSIGQVGFIVLPLAVVASLPADAPNSLAVVGIAAALVYAFNPAFAKSLLFFASGTIHSAVGTVRFDSLGGLARRAPVLAAAFLLGALSLIGVPPLVGFFGKFLVFRVAADAGAAGAAGAWLALAVALAGAVFTIAYFSRGWNRVFWGDVTETVDAAIPTRWAGSSGRRPAGQADEVVADGQGGPERPDGGVGQVRDLVLTGEVVVVVTLAACIVAFGIGFEAVYEAAESAGRAALDTQEYVDAVNPGTYAGEGHGGGGGHGGSGGNESGSDGGGSHALQTVRVAVALVGGWVA
jgi:multicomponent Na+:H+ antiporter subunit D